MPALEQGAVDIRLEHDFATAVPEMAKPTPVAFAPRPRLLALNHEVAESLGLRPAQLFAAAGLSLLTGHAPPGARPVAQVYSGHQWGVYKPILGDGRAILLGEVRRTDGRLVDLHLKGIGPTPMSRRDGFAAIGPMLREYLMGEAMHALGVPTTRALSVVATGAWHDRDGEVLPGAVLTRVAASHLRIGSVQYAAATGDQGLLRRLADHAIARLHPHLIDADAPYRALLSSIVDAHAVLTAHWMRLGFVHGVLSTDNVTLSAETIDYGPCAFIDRFDPQVWFSSIDEHGRYAYARQPEIIAWNLERLGEAMAPLLGDTADEAARFVDAEAERYLHTTGTLRMRAFAQKLGLGNENPRSDGEDRTTVAPQTVTLIAELLAQLEEEGVDFTGFFRALAAAAAGDDTAVTDLVLDRERMAGWLRRWHRSSPSAELIAAVNPLYIPRNELLDAALEKAAAGDLDDYERLLGLVTDPFRAHVDVDPVYTRPASDAAPRHRTFCGT